GVAAGGTAVGHRRADRRAGAASRARDEGNAARDRDRRLGGHHRARVRDHQSRRRGSDVEGDEDSLEGAHVIRTTRRGLALAALATVLLAGAGHAGPKRLPKSPDGIRMQPQIEQEKLVVRTLADPGFEGRGPGTAGLDSAHGTIAAWMADIGVVPGGDASKYLQVTEVIARLED